MIPSELYEWLMILQNKGQISFSFQKPKGTSEASFVNLEKRGA